MRRRFFGLLVHEGQEFVECILQGGGRFPRAGFPVPGRAVAGDGVAHEFLDFACVHALEKIPLLVVFADMVEAQPLVFAQLIFRLRRFIHALLAATAGLATRRFFRRDVGDEIFFAVFFRHKAGTW